MSLYGPLVKLEEERRRRRIEDLNRRFEATLRHMDAVSKAHEDAYKATKAVFEAAKRSTPVAPAEKKTSISWATDGKPRPRKKKGGKAR